MCKLRAAGELCGTCGHGTRHGLQAGKDSEIQSIVSAGVMKTPGLVVDGHVKIYGRVPNIEELKSIIAQMQRAMTQGANGSHWKSFVL